METVFDLEDQVYTFWENFKNEIIYKNRFHPKHKLLEYLDRYITQNKVLLSKGSTLYRARIIDYTKSCIESIGTIKELQKQECGKFEGFDEVNSFVPPADNVGPGRANPEKIVYLYTAKEMITAIAETRPRVSDHVSVAKIILQKNIYLVDFSSRNTEDDFCSKLFEVITAAFSAPCKDCIEYVPTQYISEHVKILGLDGIIFRSSFIPDGTNITIFHPEVAKVVASTPYCVDKIVYTARRLRYDDRRQEENQEFVNIINNE